jgi:hypothetical protein
MTARLHRHRSGRVARLGLLPVVLAGIALALLVPTLGTARTQTAPVNTAEPKISGTAAQGETLTATTGQWINNPTNFDFNWRRCPPDGGQGAGNCDGIVNHAPNTYTLQSADVGFTIRVEVKATNSDGKGTATSNATSVVTGSGSGPTNTSLPTITGTAQVGQTLTADKGSWASEFLTDFSYDWLRCDAAGSNCLTFGATGTTDVVAAADMGSTLRVRVTATNPSGSTQVTSAQTAVVPGSSTTPPPPPAPPAAAGCPAGRGPVQATQVTSPARLVIDRQAAAPSAIGRSSGQSVVVRYHVSDTCGQPVQGALVYATAVPFGQLSTPVEQPTGPAGYVSLTFRTLAGFPLGPRQRSVAIFVRARKQGEDLLAGISARRLFAIPVSR